MWSGSKQLRDTQYVDMLCMSMNYRHPSSFDGGHIGFFKYVFPYIYGVTDMSNLHYVLPKSIFVTYNNDTPCILRNFCVPLGLMAAILDLAILDSVLFC